MNQLLLFLGMPRMIPSSLLGRTGPPSNQPFERTRSAPASGFAGSASCRAVPIAIR
jgi:hypothetical protein